MAKRVGLGRIEKLMEQLDRNIDLEGSDVTVNTLTSDGKITTNDGGLAVIGDNLTVTNGAIIATTGSMQVTGPSVTQLTSKATAVAGAGLTTGYAGTITTHDAELASGATVTFEVGSNDENLPPLTDGSIVLVSLARTTTNRAFGNDYTVSTGVIDNDGAAGINGGDGGFQINITNNSGGPLSEALVINYIIMNVRPLGGAG